MTPHSRESASKSFCLNFINSVLAGWNVCSSRVHKEWQVTSPEPTRVRTCQKSQYRIAISLSEKQVPQTEMQMWPFSKSIRLPQSWSGCKTFQPVDSFLSKAIHLEVWYSSALYHVDSHHLWVNFCSICSTCSNNRAEEQQKYLSCPQDHQTRVLRSIW
jgi:hypothetical protein